MTDVATHGVDASTAAPRGRLGRNPWMLAWIGLAVVTALVVLLDAPGTFTPDTKPELYANPGRLLHRSLFVWQPDPHLGQMNYNTGILPVAAVLTVVRALGVPPWLLQRLLMIALLLVGAVGTARLVTSLTGRRGAGPWLAGAVHAWHPWTIVGAATLPVRLPHAVLPWVLLATHRAVRSGSWRDAALAGLAYGAMGGINGGVVNLLYVLPVLVLVAWAVAVGDTRPVRAIGGLLRTGVVAVGVSLYWLVPSLLATGSSAGDVLLATEDPVGLARLSPASEVVRGMGMWTNYVVIDGVIENPQQVAFLTSPPVVVAGFLLTVAGVVALVGARRRIQALVVAMVVTGAGVMMGLNGSAGRTPFGRALAWVFEAAPATTAFRTTNKAGGMLVLGLAIALGAGLSSGRLRSRLRLRLDGAVGVAGIAVLLLVAAGPLASGRLHPIEYPIPAYWEEAAAATDTARDDRLLLLPGNAQVRYLWGYRGVDDLDAALWDRRHVTWRSTIPAGSAPAANLLTAFDLGLELDRLAPGALSTYTRLLGSGTALVRGDTDWRRNFGRPTAELRADVLDRPATELVATHGPTAGGQGLPPALVPPDLPAVTEVELPPTSIPQAWRYDQPLLVVGDAMAVDQLARVGVDAATHPLLYVDDLGDDQLERALASGGRVVLSDTNHRRSWTIGSLTDSYTPVLAATDSVPDVDQRARSTDPAHQTVRVDGGLRVSTSTDPYSLLRRRAAGHARLAHDGSFATAWQYGALTDSRGGWLELAAERRATVRTVQVHVGTRGKAITSVRISTDSRSVRRRVVDGVATARFDQLTDRVRVTITGTEGDSVVPATVTEVVIDGDDVWDARPSTLRAPLTLSRRLETAPELAPDLTTAPLTLLLSRLDGNPSDPFDDEEGRLRREVVLPFPVTLDPTATLVAARRPGDWPDGACLDVATLVDATGARHTLRARTGPAVAAGDVATLRGCGSAVELPRGPVTIEDADLVTIDHLAAGTSPPDTDGDALLPLDPPPRDAGRDDPTRSQVQLPQGGAVLVSSGQAWHPDWQATADGEPLGAPLVVGGYAAGWLVPPGTETVAFTFSPQGPTRIAQLVSLATVVLAAAVCVRRRRRP